MVIALKLRYRTKSDSQAKSALRTRFGAANRVVLVVVVHHSHSAMPVAFKTIPVLPIPVPIDELTSSHSAVLTIVPYYYTLPCNCTVCTYHIVRDIRPQTTQNRPHRQIISTQPNPPVHTHDKPHDNHLDNNNTQTNNLPTICSPIKSTSSGHNFTVRSVPLSPHRQPTHHMR